MQNITVNTIGYISSPYKQKFAVPRQPGLVKSAKGLLTLNPPYNMPESVSGIESYSHLWLTFIFHKNPNANWKSRVKAPRLGGNKSIGVFASRSPFRPNPIGLSVVKLEDVIIEKNRVSLAISELDLVDGTPIIDIKPYVPYADSLPDAKSIFAAAAPHIKNVVFSSESEQQIARLSENHLYLRDFIHEVLQQDPRPAYKQEKVDDKIYAMTLYAFNIKWCMLGNNTINVISIEAHG